MSASWWLKIERAEKHIQEFEAEVRRYIERRPYRAERAVEPQRKQGDWRYVLRMTEQPDPRLAVIIGDVLHNVRGALDHLAVAATHPSRIRSAGFPLEEQDIWRSDASGQFVHPDGQRRIAWESRVRGMPIEAVAAIEGAQPYHLGQNAPFHALALLNRLDDADKHRQLVVVQAGLDNTITFVTARGEILVQPGGIGHREDGAEVSHFGYRRQPPLSESEVHVEVRGTPRVVIKVAQMDGYFPALELLHQILAATRDVASELEQHVGRGVPERWLPPDAR